MKNRISVIIPVYNDQSGLISALSSIGEQTRQPDEVIVVDDGSEPAVDISQLALSEAEGSPFDVQIVRQENRGAAAARNTGFKASTGDFVIFWDADVTAVPNMLEKLENALLEHTQAAFSYCSHSFGSKKMPGQAFDPVALKKANYIHTTSLIRRDAFPGFDESLKRFQDWDVWLSIAENGGTGVFVDEYLFIVAPGGSMSVWLPQFAYRFPWKFFPGFHKHVRAYERAREIIATKHQLT